MFPGTSSIFFSRVNLSAYDPHADPSLRARVDSLQDAMPGSEAHPFLGNGAGAFAVGHQDNKGNPGWLSDWSFTCSMTAASWPGLLVGRHRGVDLGIRTRCCCVNSETPGFNGRRLGCLVLLQHFLRLFR